MTNFLHTLAEELRTREKFMEDVNHHPIFELESKSFSDEYSTLKEEFHTFADRIEALEKEGCEFNETFERSIMDKHTKLKIRYEAWQNRLS